ncbi:MAG: aromatic acid/H+ symport family MFS transporter [Actinomycetota bacterium]|nr:aromatic acid/H+ symport family MFS transporter [Actinomycetota bacterium]
MSTNADTLGEEGGSVTRWVVILCWVAVALDGFDLVVLGAVTPALLQYEAWGLTPGRVGAITSYGLIGMMIGALTIGALTDVIGRRKAILISVTSFSLFTGLLAAAPSPEIFGLFRFLAGLGLGGLIPTAATLVSEYAQLRRGSSSITFMMTGYHVGGVLTALFAIPILPALGWRAMFVIGALPALVLVPLMLKKLPESPSFLIASGRRPEAEALADQYGITLEPEKVREVLAEERASESGRFGALKTLFSGGYLLGTLAFSVASFMGLLLVYGLNQWLPTIMRDAGYALGAALTFLLVLNLGAVVGLLVAGPVADRYGSKVICAGWFGLAAVFLFLLSVQMPLVLTYFAVFATGVWVFSAQVLLYAYVSKHYPTSGRGTALGWAAGIGRIGAICGPLLGGFLVGAQLAVPWGFYAFALVGLLGSIFIALVPRSPAESVEQAPVGPEATAR